MGAVPVPKLEPETGVSTPLLGLMVYAATVLDVKSGTYANLPAGSTTMLSGVVPTFRE